ncbi:MAG: MXAN_5187 family protein [Kofleriaceae bacterium]
MFWSKIWLFLLAAAAALAFTVALLAPRPAQRARADDERQRLVVACDVVNIQLKSAARSQIDVAGAFARQPGVVAALAQASTADAIELGSSKAARELVLQTIAGVSGTRPDFAILVDSRGRVLARAGSAGVVDDEYGDTLGGRFLVDDALAGYLRDDLWRIGTRLYRVAGAPVVRGGEYVGAVIVGNAVSKQFAEEVMRPLGATIGFYVKGELAISSSATVLDREVFTEYGKLAQSPADLATDCKSGQPFVATSGKQRMATVIARLPGEARFDDAFFAVYLEETPTQGLLATLDQVRKDDLSLASFPWIPIGLAFLAALALGLVVMALEHDRPVRRLAADAVALAKGQGERLPEERHRGKLGSVARSVNIHVDKLAREARAARRDLDQLLGPADGSGAALDLAPPPPARPVPPPAEFRFQGGAMGGAPELDLAPVAPSAARPAAPPPRPPAVRAKTPAPVPPPAPVAPPPPQALDDDILASLSGARIPAPPPPEPDEDTYFRQVFDEFVAQKARCGEPTAGLTYAKFVDKLRKNKDDLMAKPGTIGVRFAVYVKDGKAALKATPIKDA